MITRQGRWVVQKCPLFVNVYTIEKFQRRGVGGQNCKSLVNVVCERPLSDKAKIGVNSKSNASLV
jgi:hypothetical protein